MVFDSLSFQFTACEWHRNFMYTHLKSIINLVNAMLIGYYYFRLEQLPHRHARHSSNEWHSLWRGKQTRKIKMSNQKGRWMHVSRWVARRRSRAMLNVEEYGIMDYGLDILLSLFLSLGVSFFFCRPYLWFISFFFEKMESNNSYSNMFIRWKRCQLLP